MKNYKFALIIEDENNKLISKEYIQTFEENEESINCFNNILNNPKKTIKDQINTMLCQRIKDGINEKLIENIILKGEM